MSCSNEAQTNISLAIAPTPSMHACIHYSGGISRTLNSGVGGMSRLRHRKGTDRDAETHEEEAPSVAAVEDDDDNDDGNSGDTSDDDGNASSLFSSLPPPFLPPPSASTAEESKELPLRRFVMVCTVSNPCVHKHRRVNTAE